MSDYLLIEKYKYDLRRAERRLQESEKQVQLLKDVIARLEQPSLPLKGGK